MLGCAVCATHMSLHRSCVCLAVLGVSYPFILQYCGLLRASTRMTMHAASAAKPFSSVVPRFVGTVPRKFAAPSISTAPQRRRNFAVQVLPILFVQHLCAP